MHLEYLLDSFDVVFGLSEMSFETSFEAGIGRFFDHLRQRLHDLVFGVVDVPQLVHEQIIQRFDIFTKQSHDHPRFA